MSRTPTTAYHFGPSIDCVGGIASVIATLTTGQIGADEVLAIPTWIPDSHIGSAVPAARALLAALRLPRSSVVHVHMSERGSFVREALIVAAAKYRRLPCVVSIHGAGFVAFSERRPRLVSHVLGMACAVTVLGQDAHAAVRRVNSRVHLELIPNPVTLDAAAGPVKDTSELVLFAGEIGLRKGADVLARAWKTVAARRPQARCLMLGPATGLTVPTAPRLEILGPVGRDEVRELIRRARVVALPSRGEALPMILVEAGAAGRPFVSTSVGGIESLAGGGMIVPVGDHEALADALTSFLESPESAQAAGERGRAICDERMSPRVVDMLLRQLYAYAIIQAGRAPGVPIPAAYSQER